MSAVSLNLDPAELRPLLQTIVAEVLAVTDRLPGDRMAFTEAEAAKLLGLRVHQLRDQRLAGRLSFSRGPKNAALYTRADLAAYLLRTREEASRT